MPSSPADATTSSRVLHVFDSALDQSHDIKAEVQACAEDLGSANDLAKTRITDGATTLPAARALRNGMAVERPAGHQTAARIAGLVREAIESPIDVGALQFAITPSIGIALYPEHSTSGQKLIAHADAAMYRARQPGSHCELFERSIVSSVLSRRLAS